jgi:hypothetical protein
VYFISLGSTMLAKNNSFQQITIKYGGAHILNTVKIR